MNVGSNCKTCRFKRDSEVLLNWSKTALVNTVYKLFKRLFSYTRLNAKLGFSKTSFVNMAVTVILPGQLRQHRQVDLSVTFHTANSKTVTS